MLPLKWQEERTQDMISEESDFSFEDFEREEQERQHKVISVLEAKRKHEGTWRILGKIVTVSEMYVIEVTPEPPETEVLYKDAKFIQLEDIVN